MVNIDNQQVLQGIVDDLKCNPSDKLPKNVLLGGVQLTFDIKRKPYCNIVKNLIHSSNNAATLYTTPTGKDFYLVGFNFHSVVNSTGVSTDLSLSAVIFSGETVKIASASTNAAAGNTGHINLTNNFSNNPIKLARGTNILLSNTTSAGNSSTDATIFGFTMETE